MPVTLGKLNQEKIETGPYICLRIYFIKIPIKMAIFPKFKLQITFAIWKKITQLKQLVTLHITGSEGMRAEAMKVKGVMLKECT